MMAAVAIVGTTTGLLLCVAYELWGGDDKPEAKK